MIRSGGSQTGETSALQEFAGSWFYRLIARILIFTQLLWGLPIQAAAAGDPAMAATLQVGQYQPISNSRVTETLFDFVLTARVANTVDHRFAKVRAKLRSLSVSTAVINGNLSFGLVGPYQTVTSQDTFTIRQDRTKPFNPADLAWDVQYNTPPAANAGQGQTARVGATVRLDGSASSDIDGDALNYSWRFLSVPADSHATLSDSIAVRPSFTIDRPGSYQVGLVVNDGAEDSLTASVTVTTENSPPVADAGSDQTVHVGDAVRLDGSHSSDVDGDALSYNWRFASLPTDSRVALQGAATANPGFTVDKPGIYNIQLVVSDGKLQSSADLVIVSTQNSKPIARAGPSQTVHVGDSAQLDGSASTDVDGDPLTYWWSLTAKPADSVSQLSATAVANPKLDIDQPGVYVAQLLVNDGKLDSAPSTVTLMTENSKPVANAGKDQTAHVGNTVVFDGSASKDPDHDPLAFQWSLAHQPVGSLAQFDNPKLAKPQLTLDLPGSYIAQLIVNDGKLASDPASVTVTTENSKPLANAGNNRAVNERDTVRLDGSASTDADKDPLAYRWALLNRPDGSAAALSGETTANPTFTADLPGRYIAQLIVNDGKLDSDPATVSIDAANVNDPPRIISAPVTKALEGQAYTYALQATDPDVGDLLVYSLIGAPTGMTINAATGLIQWTASAWSSNVTVRVDDGGGLFAIQSFTITVERANHAPSITSTAVTTAMAGQAYGYPVQATDPDVGDHLSFSLSQAPQGMAIDPASGLIQWTPSQGGSYPVTVKATDSGGLSDSQSFTLVVEVPNRPPVITSTPILEAADSFLYQYDVTAIDPDAGDIQIFSLTQAPPGMSIDQATGRIQWTPTSDQVGDQPVTVRVRDFAGLSDQQTFTIKVIRQRINPVAQNDSFTVDLSKPTAVAALGVLANDRTFEYDLPFSALLITPPKNGSVNLNLDGSFTYTPNANALPPNGPLQVKLKWSWTGSNVVPNSVDVILTPGVIDLNGDGIPDIVFGTTAHHGNNIDPGILRAVRGDNGTELFVVSNPAYTINAASSVAVGNIDDDPQPEIVASDSSGTRLIAFKNDGSFKWRSSNLDQINWGTPSLADLDGDGKTEIIVGRQVLNSDGSLRWTGTGGRGKNYDSGAGPVSLVADIDLDGMPEVIAGNTAYSSSGAIKWQQTALPDGYAAVGNFDADPYAEVVLVAQGKVYLLNHDGTIQWGPVTLPGGGMGGPPTVADFDGDGQPEIGVAGATRYVVFETDGSVKWQSVTQDTSSQVTGSSVFDFEGDGSAEVVYRDELKFRVYKGSDGTTLFETPMTSNTYHEYPLVADVDGDGHAEIVTCGDHRFGGPASGLYVFGDQNNRWVPTRKIWNQHSYHITNVNEDGTIPKNEPVNWLIPGLNNFRLNTFAPSDTARTDSFTYKALSGLVESNVATVTLQATQANHPPSMTSQAVTAAQVGKTYGYIATATDPDVGDLLTFSLLQAPQGMGINPLTGMVQWTPGAAQAGSQPVTVQVRDPVGLAATQSFTVAVAANHPPVAQNDAYSVPQDQALGVNAPGVLSNDSDTDNNPLAAIQVTGPGNGQLALNSNGAFTYTPNAGFFGTDSFTYKANDGTADSNIATVAIAVIKPNHPPTITSTPNISQWIQLTPTGTLPAPRLGSGSGYDAVNDRLIVFAGEIDVNNSGQRTNEVWVLVNATGVNGTPAWQQLTPVGGPPQTRHASTTVYDPTANRLIIYGGCTGHCGTALSDAWVLTNANGLGGTPQWIQLPSGTATTVPGGAYDPISNRMMVFGGLNSGSPYADQNIVQILVDANGIGSPRWINLATTGTLPPARSELSNVVYDQNTNRLMVFGGYQWTANTEFNDVWVLTNANGLGGAAQWQKLNPQGTLPPIRSNAPYSYDPNSNRLIIFGGYTKGTDYSYNDSWVLTNANGLGGTPQWIKLSPPGSLPKNRYFNVSAYYPKTNRLIISLGHYYIGNVAYEWLNDAWALTNASGYCTTGQGCNYDVDASDPDAGDALTFSLVSGPQGMTVDPATGQVRWTPTADQTGDNVATVQVRDSGGLTATQSVTLTVAPVAVPNVVGLAPEWGDAMFQAAGLNTGTKTSLGGAITLNFDTLPSQQGWTFGDTTYIYPGETTAFSVSGGVLFQNTMGFGYGPYSAPRYNLFGIVDTRLPFDMRLRARVLNEERASYGRPYGFAYALFTGQREVEAGFGLNDIILGDGRQQYPHDNTAFHEYRITGATWRETQQFLIDGNLLGNVFTESIVFSNSLALGDGTQGANAQAEITAYSFSQPHIAAQNPPAGTLVKNGSAVDFGIQEGPATQTVPDVRNQAQTAAQIAISNAGLQVGTVTQETSDTVPNGFIIRQKPVAGTHIMQNFKVDLVVSSKSTNHPPAINSAPVASATEALPYLYQVQASDPDSGDILSYSLTAAPTGMGIDAATGLIQWTPATAQIGSQPVTVKAQDQGGLFATQSFTLTVAADQPPTITSTPPATGVSGQLYRYQIEATDPDASDLLAYSLVAGPDTMAVNPNSGLLQWTPDDSQIGAHDGITVKVADKAGKSVTQTFSLSIKSSNEPPAVTSTPPGTATENLLYSYQLAATDPNAGDKLTYSLTQSPDGMGIHPANGLIAWTPTTAQIGSHTVTVRVQDQKGAWASQTFSLTVKSSNEPPTITSTPTYTATENLLYTYQATATDPNVGDNLRYSLAQYPDGMSIHPATGLIGWTPTTAQIGSHTVTVRVQDQKGAWASQTYALTVETASVVVPDVIGYSQTDAQALLQGYKLTPGSVLSVYDETYAAGVVLSQQPLAGVSVAKGAAVNLVVSAGSAPVSVPSVAGLTQAAASNALFAARLNTGTLSTANSNVFAAGVVMDQNPAAGTYLPKAGAVDLVVSIGPAMVSTPNVVGLAQAAAQAALATANLNVGTVGQSSSDKVPAGQVIRQYPAAGVSVAKGAAVDLTVSTGPAVSNYTAIVVQPTAASVVSGAVLNFSAIGILPDGSSEPAVGISWSSSNPAVASINADGQASALVEGTATLSARKGSVAGSATLTVKSPTPGDSTLPVAAITSPAGNATVTEPAPVIGTANDANFLRYELALSPLGQNQFTVFKTGDAPVVNGTLGTLDPTLLINDQYDLRLTVWDRRNNANQAQIRVQVAREQKVGNFTVAFQDTSVSMACLPLTVTRVYDSRDKTRGDFGVGWRLDVQTMRLRESGTMGADWEVYFTYTAGPFGIQLPTYVLVDDDVHKVSLTLPDGKVEEFDLTPTPSVQKFNEITVVTAGYTPRPGTLGTLAPVGPATWGLSNAVGGTELIDSDYNLFDPRQYQYTAPDGSAYVIDKFDGVKSVQCANGQKLEFGPNGISHSDGVGIGFTRDSQGRITAITDPAGNTRRYAYDGNGDLLEYTDPENHKTRYTYDYRHNLISIDDPRGVQAVRNDYDADGRLVGHTDSTGAKIAYQHDLVARKETVTDRLGNATLYEYDDKGNVLKQTDALGNATTFTYDAFGNQLTKTDPLGRTTTMEYDTRRNVLRETDPLGHVTRYQYTALNDVRQITDPLGRVTANVYDSQGNITASTDPLGNVTHYGYDKGGIVYPGNGLLTSKTDALGNKTGYQYDAQGRMTQETDALGNATAYTYDASGNRASETRTRGKADGSSETLVTRFQYDSLNRLVKTTYPNGSTSQTVYNAIGKQAQTIDALGHATVYEYDSLGRLVKTTHPDGLTETSRYDAEGHRLSGTDRAGRVTRFEYDALGRLVKTIYPDGAASQTAYDAAGQLVASTDALGHVTRYEYDLAGRRTKVTDALGHVTAFEYDAAGNQVKITDANGHLTQFVYDAANRRTEVVYTDGSKDQTGYDALGRNTAKTDQAGVTTQFGYDKQGRLVKVTDALNQATTYAYDELGRQIQQTDANGHTTTFAYDALGRRVSRTLPLGQTETFEYDAAGSPIRHTDFNGKTTSYLYDELKRLVSKTPDLRLNQAPVTFSYTATGQRASMTDASGTTAYAYDDRDRLVEKATPQGTLSYDYNLAGSLVSIRSSHTDGVSLDYSYDALNRLAKATDNTLVDGDTTYAYDNAGNLSAYTYPNGVATNYTYNNLNRLANMAVDKAGVGLAAYAYSLGKTGNRLSVAELSGRTVNYAYDALYRLTGETIGGVINPAHNGVIGYVYDPVGNRLTRTSTVTGIANQSFTYNANDQLNTDGYDANGNTTATDGKTYAYDSDNRLTGQNGGQVGIIYDGDGNRVSKTVGGVTTQYLVDTLNPTGYAQVLEEIENGQVATRYTYGSDLISQSRKAGSTWQTSFYGYDGHGSVRFLTDANGLVTDRYDYDAFGNLVNQEGTTPNSYLYSGEQRDFSLGLDYLRARMMNSASGRYLSLDASDGSKALPSSIHKYAYGNGNPISNIDPSGNTTLQEVVSTTTILSILSTTAFGITNSRLGPATERDWLPDAVVWGASVSASSTALGFGLLSTAAFTAGFLPAGTIAPVIAEAQGIWGLAGGGMVGVEIVANARTNQLGWFFYKGAQGVIQQGPWGASVNFYQSIVYKLNSLDEFKQGKTIFGGFGMDTIISYNVFQGINGTDYNGFTLGLSKSVPPGWTYSFGLSASVSGPNNVTNGASALEPWLTWAWPPNGALLRWKSYRNR